MFTFSLELLSNDLDDTGLPRFDKVIRTYGPGDIVWCGIYLLQFDIKVQTMWCRCAYDFVQRPRSLQDRRTTFEDINPMLVRCKVTISVV